MQTFLPYPDFGLTARTLDYRRLGKQRVEAWQILNSLRNGTGWKHHPAVKMWAGYEQSLILYGLTMCDEWVERGYKDSLSDRFYQELVDTHPPHPDWIGVEEFHNSHKSNLLRKYPEYYRKFWPDLPDNLPYYWPTHYDTARI